MSGVSFDMYATLTVTHDNGSGLAKSASNACFKIFNKSERSQLKSQDRNRKFSNLKLFCNFELYGVD